MWYLYLYVLPYTWVYTYIYMDKYKPGESINFTNGKKKKKNSWIPSESMNPEANSVFPGEGTRANRFLYLTLSTFLILSSLSLSIYLSLYLSISVYIFITDLLLSLIELTDFIIWQDTRSGSEVQGHLFHLWTIKTKEKKEIIN